MRNDGVVDDEACDTAAAVSEEVGRGGRLSGCWSANSARISCNNLVKKRRDLSFPVDEATIDTAGLLPITDVDPVASTSSSSFPSASCRSSSAAVEAAPDDSARLSGGIDGVTQLTPSGVAGKDC